MNLKVAVAALGLSMIGVAPAFASVRHDQDTVTDFTLRTGQSKTIVASPKMGAYRVCFERSKNDRFEPFEAMVPPAARRIALRLVADGRSSTITAGNCTDLQAKSISISPAGLGPDGALAGRIEDMG